MCQTQQLYISRPHRLQPHCGWGQCFLEYSNKEEKKIFECDCIQFFLQRAFLGYVCSWRQPYKLVFSVMLSFLSYLWNKNSCKLIKCSIRLLDGVLWNTLYKKGVEKNHRQEVVSSAWAELLGINQINHWVGEDWAEFGLYFIDCQHQQAYSRWLLFILSLSLLCS